MYDLLCLFFFGETLESEENDGQPRPIAVMEYDALVTFTHDNGFFRDCCALLTILPSEFEIYRPSQSMSSRLHLELLKSSSSSHQVGISLYFNGRYIKTKATPVVLLFLKRICPFFY